MNTLSKIEKLHKVETYQGSKIWTGLENYTYIIKAKKYKFVIQTTSDTKTTL